MRKFVLAAAFVAAPVQASAAVVSYGFSEVRSSVYVDPRLGSPNYVIDPVRSGTFSFDTATNVLLAFTSTYGPLNYSPTYPYDYATLTEAVTGLFNTKTAGTCDLACFIDSINSGSYSIIYNPYRFTLTFGGAFDATVIGRAPVTTVHPASEIGRLQVLAPVPEPSTWALMLLGFFGIGSCLRRRNGPGRSSKSKIVFHA